MATDQPLIFLDIDGVLLPFGDGAEAADHLFPDRCLAALSLILAELPTAELVLSSTWRANPQFQQDIIDEFSRYAAASPNGSPFERIESFTQTTCLHTFGVRQHEIHKFLRSLPRPPSAWIALDDEPLLEGRECAALRREFEGHCVQCESSEGLTRALALAAVEKLRTQMRMPSGRSGSSPRSFGLDTRAKLGSPKAKISKRKRR